MHKNIFKQAAFVNITITFLFSQFSCSSETSESSLRSKAEEVLIEKGEFFNKYYNISGVVDYESLSNNQYRVVCHDRYDKEEIVYICSINNIEIYELKNLRGFEEYISNGVTAVANLDFEYKMETGSTIRTSSITAYYDLKKDGWQFVTKTFSDAHRLLKAAKKTYKSQLGK